MTINNNKITFSIILFRTDYSEDYKNNLYYTGSDFFLWDHRTETVKEIELPGLKGKHMIDLNYQEHETLWLSIFQKELANILNIDLESEAETTYNLYLNTIIYNNKLGGRYITNCVVPLNNQLNWSEINKAEEEYTLKGSKIKNGNAF